MYTLKKLLLISSLVWSSATCAQSINESFLQDYQQSINSLVGDYNNKYPLAAQVFDIANKGFYNVLSNRTKRQYKDENLAVTYMPESVVNGEKKPLCFILYDSKKKDFLTSYLNNTALSQHEVINYLALHEFGHCVAFNLYHNKQIPKIESSREHEKLADMFAISYLLHHGQASSVEKIMVLLNKVKSDDVHSNYDFLQSFLKQHTMTNNRDTLSIFQHVYNFYSKS